MLGGWRAGRPPRGRPRSARPLGLVLPAGSVSSWISLPPLVGDPLHTTHTLICTHRLIVWFTLRCDLPRTPSRRSSKNPPSTHSGEFLHLRSDTGRFDHAPWPVCLVVTDLHLSLPHTVPEFHRELRGFLGAPGRHNDAARVVRREIRCDAASHDLVAASDQDASVLQHRLHLLWRAGSQFPGANDAAEFGNDPENNRNEKGYKNRQEQQREQYAEQATAHHAAAHHRAHAAHHAASTESRNEQQYDDRPDQSSKEYLQAVAHGLLTLLFLLV